MTTCRTVRREIRLGTTGLRREKMKYVGMLAFSAVMALTTGAEAGRYCFTSTGNCSQPVVQVSCGGCYSSCGYRVVTYSGCSSHVHSCHTVSHCAPAPVCHSACSAPSCGTCCKPRCVKTSCHKVSCCSTCGTSGCTTSACGPAGCSTKAAPAAAAAPAPAKEAPAPPVEDAPAPPAEEAAPAPAEEAAAGDAA